MTAWNAILEILGWIVAALAGFVAVFVGTYAAGYGWRWGMLQAQAKFDGKQSRGRVH